MTVTRTPGARTPGLKSRSSGESPAALVMECVSLRLSFLSQNMGTTAKSTSLDCED